MKQKIITILIAMLGVISIAQAQTPYAVLNDGTLTFYYDNQKNSREGSIFTTFSVSANASSLNGWGAVRSHIINVVFDSSFAEYHGLTSTAYLFYKCDRLKNIQGFENLNTENVTSMLAMFYGCKYLTSLDLSSFNTRNVTSMYDMFYGCSSLTSLDLSSFDTQNVTSMYEMFYGCNSLTSLDLSSFNTQNVTSMNGMFYGCSSLTSLDLSSFNTQNVKDMSHMFSGCEALESVYVGEAWKTEKVTSSDNMFYACYSMLGEDYTNYYIVNPAGAHYNTLGLLRNIANKEKPRAYAVLDGRTLTFYCDNESATRKGTVYKKFQTDFEGVAWKSEAISITKVNFDSSFANCDNIVTMGYWFDGLTSLLKFTGVENLNTKNVKDMRYMFRNVTNMAAIDLTKLNTEKVQIMAGMFAGCGATSLDLSSFDTRNVTNMGGMFYGCSALTSLDLSGFNTQKVKSMTGMFYGCSSLTSLNLDSFDTKSVTDMSWMFYGCNSLTSLDLGNFYTQNVTDMKYMFYSCSGLTTLDLSSFDTQDVTDMSWMFSGCSSLTSLDLSSFDTQNVTDMNRMFLGCKSLASLDLSSFNTQNVTSMYDMFYGCSSLTSLDLSSFNTQNVTGNTGMASMFSGCSSLASLDLSGFNTKNVMSMISMFSGCSSLTSLNISSFDTQNVTALTNMFSNCSSLTSLDLSSFNTELVKSFEGMFSGCKKLETIYVGDDWFVVNATSSNKMFSGCSSIKGQYGTKYNSSLVDKTVAHYFDGGYLTLKPKELQPIEEETVITFNDNDYMGGDLMSTVINNVYVAIDNARYGSVGHYDKTEKCIVIYKTTSSSAMEKALESQLGTYDFLSNFTGMMIDVNGKGCIKVNAQTFGNRKVAIKIGDNDATASAQTVRGDVVVNYDVAENTKVYIYATEDGNMPQSLQMNTTSDSSDNEVKIYSITVVPNTTDISTVTSQTKTIQGKTYNIAGQQVKENAKGLLISNGVKFIRR